MKYSIKKPKGGNGKTIELTTTHRLMPFLLSGLVVLLIAFLGIHRLGCVNRYTPTGHEGYVRSDPIFGAASFVGIQKGPTSTGWVWRRRVINIDIRPRTYSEYMQILTAERLELKFRAHARIRLRKGSVKEVVEKFGGDGWYRANVQQQFRSVMRSKVQELGAFQVQSKMIEIAQSVLDDMKNRYKNTPIEFLNVNIGDIQYPDVVVQSVVRKFVTNEDNERKDIELKIARRQIEIGIAEANGTANAQKIIRTTLDPMFIQYEALMAMEQFAGSKNTTFIVMPVSKDKGSPLIMNLAR